MPSIYDKINNGLSVSDKWLLELDVAYDEYLGPVGASDLVRGLYHHMAICFDWDYFLQRKKAFKAKHRESFEALAQALESSLKDFAWPDPAEFPYVKRVWPAPKQVASQFFHLVKRLKQQYDKRAEWSSITHYDVVPVVVPGGRSASAVAKCFRGTASTASILVSCIWSFLLADGQQTFRVRADSLRRPGYANAARGARKLEGVFRGRCLGWQF